MPEPLHIGLDNPVFRGRLKVSEQTQRPLTAVRRPVSRHPSRQTPAKEQGRKLEPPAPIWQNAMAQQPAPEPPLHTVSVTPQPAPYALPSQEAVYDEEDIPHRQIIESLRQKLNPRIVTEALHQYTGLQKGMVAAAALIFIVGLTVSLQTAVTNHNVTQQVSALSNSAAGSGSGSAPSTTPPTKADVSRYTVAPDLPRYIKIPKLGVNARVKQLGVLQNGALETPTNVFDTGWYTGSSKPGQLGAMVIDGHVSSWTTHGVFYGLKTLRAGDTLQIERGDGQVLTYQVVKTQTYTDDTVDMAAAMSPIVKETPGLNLITCTGKVKPGTSEFDHRLVVFTKQID